MQKLGTAGGFLLEGDAALARKQYPLAISAFERAYKLAPSSSTLIRLHQALSGVGREEVGDKLILSWLSSQPNDFSARLYLAERLTTRKQFKPASDHYLYLNRQVPNNLLVLNNLAWTLSELNDKRAIPYAELAFKLNPNNPAVMDTLGWLLVQQGQVSRGVTLLQQALSKAPDAPEIHYHLAVALIKSGDPARAKSEFIRLLASGNSFPHEQEARAQLNQLQQSQNGPR